MTEQSGQTTMTVTEVLRMQHEQVTTMFGQMDELHGQDRAELFDCLRMMLAVHETAEEEVVHPAARKISDAGERAVEARLEEENEAKKMLSNLEKMSVGDEQFDKQFAAFRAAVLEHAEAEETEIFLLLESKLDRHDLTEMADSLLIAEEMAPTHPHPHGPESAMGNLLLGPFVAMADKVRDKLAERRRK
jgi:hemerythrin superfamily protein